MFKTLKIKLAPTPIQRQALLSTLERCNAACNWIAEQAYAARSTNKIGLQKLVYYAVRERFSLSAQMTIRAIAKVVDAYKRDKEHRPHFRPHGAVVYDQRILSFVGSEAASILTLEGRHVVPLVISAYHASVLGNGHLQGQADLIYQRGQWYLVLAVDVPAAPCESGPDFLGIDLGIVNLATDSDGQSYSGAAIERCRRILAHRRRNLQRKRTKAAKRKLRKLAGKQARFQRDCNHCIAKQIVRTAKDTGRGIALENLTGLRRRTTVRRPQRARHANWAFFQLKTFILYKAREAGVLVQMVDPRNTSRLCPRCGCIDQANRPSQSQFLCVQCGFAAPADTNAACNIRVRARAVVMPPMVSNSAATVSAGVQGQATGL
jgi:IS605 OrfB family transposase